MTIHPDLAALEAHLTDSSEAVAVHAAQCQACRSTLETLHAHAVLGDELRAALHSGPSTAPGREPPTIDGYELLEWVASGGQGFVWRAIQRSTRRLVAIKCLAGAHAAGPRARARFAREVELAATLSHPRALTSTPWAFSPTSP